jgi:hypothetical protein
LLESFPGGSVGRLRLDDSDAKIPAIPEQVVYGLPWAVNGVTFDKHDANIGEASLLADLGVSPTRAVQLRENIRPAGVGFIYGHSGSMS